MGNPRSVIEAWVVVLSSRVNIQRLNLLIRKESKT